jgi:RNA polymerase sigma factor (sigma-70 family)
MNKTEVPVLVIDDDTSFRRALERLLRSVGLPVRTFASAREFLQHELSAGPACLLLDVRMPGLSGLELQELLATTGHQMPIIFLTGYGTIPMSVQAMKSGAIDFLQKPCDDQLLLEAVYHALEQAQQAWDEHTVQRALLDCLETLTPRERDVLALVVTGMLNKQMADTLGMSEKTVKTHRARVMKKMHATSLAELVRMVDKVKHKLSPSGF